MKSKISGPAWLFVIVALAGLLFTISVSAQEARGTITGNVKDATQAVVPGVAVKITNVAMGTTVSVPTNDSGFFQAPYLIPGTYRVSVEHTGFKKYIREGIVLRVNDTLELEIALEVGGAEETITITGVGPALETTNASMGEVVDARRIAELPIGHGDPYSLIGLAGGVNFARDQRLDRPFEPTHIVGYSINGTRANRSDLTIDGVASTATANANEVISSFVPPQDLVQEFKVQTATFDAQFGNTEGGVTNLSIKSGTNKLHGSAYYANFTPGTSANDFYANRGNIPLGDFYYHRLGGTIGGPVVLPKLYKGQNKTFFMYGFETIPEARPRNNGTFQIPTEKMRSGDFSDLLAIGPQFQLYNPYSGVLSSGNVVRVPFRCDTTTGNPLPVDGQNRQAQDIGSPCNMIPAALINPVARNFVDNIMPLPTSPATAPDGTNNFQQPDLNETTRYYSNTIRIDHVVSDKQRIFGRVSWYDRDSNYNNYYRNLATGEWFSFFSRQGVIDDVYSLNPTTVLNFRYGYNRFIRVINSNPDGRGFDLTSLGFPSSFANLISDDVLRFPRFDISGYQGTGIGGEFRPNDTHNVVAVMNKALGKHSLKSGMEFRAYRETSGFYGNDQSGRFSFDNSFTRAQSNTTDIPQLGHSFASFLMGIPASGLINQPGNYAETSTTWGFFVHDDWRVNSRLTLNLGLRYELEGAMTERYNRSVSGFDFDVVQPMEAAARAAFVASQSTPANRTPEITQFNVPGGLLFPGVDGEPRGLYETPKNNFMPRIGFAFQLNEKTVVRGGYGIFFGFLGQRRSDVFQSGFATSTPLNVTTNNGVSFIETLSNPFQNGLVTPSGSSRGIETSLGQSITFFNPQPLSPYNQRWQIGFQRELAGGFVAEASYVGNRGTHIEITRNINTLPNQYLSTSPTRDSARNSYLTALVPNPFRGLMPADAGSVFTADRIQRQRLLRPYPQFDAVNTTTNEGYSWYHSMQLNLQKRFAKGYTIEMSYTFSKFMEAIELLNAGDPRPTEIISNSDIPHRFTVSGIYELPFGKNQRFFSNVSSVASYLVSGWQLSGIYSLQGGFPIGNFGNALFTGDVNDILLPEDERTLTRWINTEAGFNKTSNQQLVNNVRTFPSRFSFLRAPRTNNIDLGIMKRTKFGEGEKEAQFRAELLNAFNHPLLFTAGQVNLTPTERAFGQVTAGTQANYPRRIQLTFKFLF
jgi:hypothetical protein